MVSAVTPRSLTLPAPHPSTTSSRRRRWTSPRRAAALLSATALLLTLVSCDAINTVARPDQQVVLTGADVAGLVGTNPDQIVAFALSTPFNDPTWVQMPVQVDERKVVDFGVAPGSNATPGTTGTVYGSTATSGVALLQYADAGTFTGADTDPDLDADDEVVFMARDAGGKRQPGTADPAGAVPGSGVQVQVDDPLGDDQQGWVYLYESDGSLDPAAGRDYVGYDFTLTSGAYTTTYQRANGPNPETSVVTTDTYQARMTDRWDDSDWRITAGSASGVDLLDGLKNEFSLGFCGRSNITFQDAEGAFVANIDGPVRAIRSYVGANSGPLTQRTNIFYRDHQEIRTNLRVHGIPGVLDYLDYSAAALGMTYGSSTIPGGVAVDGAPDVVSTEVPTWEGVRGAPGSIVTTVRIDTTMSGGDDIDAIADETYLDQETPGTTQCWGDSHLYGASGPGVNVAIPNTDPRSAGAALFTTTRTVHYGPPNVTPADAALIASRVDTPLLTTVTSSP